MAQAQPGDVGFGYLRDHHESVEMPETDQNGYEVTTPRTPLKSPLKSAMKTPGAAPRDVGKAILSPAFQDPISHEEYLEKREKHTDKQQARDVVSTNCKHERMDRELIKITENQNSCPNGKDAHARRELLLLANSFGYAHHGLYNFQRNKITAQPRRFHCLGAEPKDLAASHPPLHRLCLTPYVDCDHLRLLEGWTQTSRESSRLLHSLRSRILRLQHRYVGHWSRHSARLTTE